MCHRTGVQQISGEEAQACSNVWHSINRWTDLIAHDREPGICSVLTLKTTSRMEMLKIPCLHSDNTKLSFFPYGLWCEYIIVGATEKCPWSTLTFIKPQSNCLLPFMSPTCYIHVSASALSPPLLRLSTFQFSSPTLTTCFLVLINEEKSQWLQTASMSGGNTNNSELQGLPFYPFTFRLYI